MGLVVFLGGLPRLGRRFVSNEMARVFPSPQNHRNRTTPLIFLRDDDLLVHHSSPPRPMGKLGAMHLIPSLLMREYPVPFMPFSIVVASDLWFWR